MKKDSNKRMKKTEENKYRIIDALLSGQLDDEMREKVCLWLLENDGSEAWKAEIVEEVARRKSTYPLKVDAETLRCLNELKKRLEMPEDAYELRDGQYEIPVYKPIVQLKPSGKTSGYKWRVSVAAVLLPALLVMTSLLFFLEQSENGRQQTAQHITISVDSTLNAGEQAMNGTHLIVAKNSDIQLPDHSIVRMEVGSHMRHIGNFKEKRHVEFSGKAHFNVAKATTETDHFTVRTEHLDIKVLGTQFELHSPANRESSTIRLYHGSVEVNAGGQTHTMRPTDLLHYNHETAEITLSTIPYSQLTYDGMPGLMFENVSLSEVFRKMESDYGLQFDIEGEISADDFEVRGDFTQFSSLCDFMDRLQMILGCFTYELADQEIKITIKS